MITGKNRFRGRRDPRIVLKHGKAVRSSNFQVKYLDNNKGTYRAAVIVSKKVAKSAPKRNRIRRRVYELIRNEEISSSKDFIVLVFDKKMTDVPQGDLKKELLSLFGKAGITK